MSLVNFLMKLKYEIVTIKMNNETHVQGTVTGIDPFTETFTLENVKMIVKERKPIRLKVLIIIGNYINYCILLVNPPLHRMFLQGNPIEKVPFRGRGKVRRLET